MQRFWRIVLVTAALLVAAAATVLGVAFSIGAFADEGRFSAAPGCGVLDAATVAPLLPNPQVAADGDNCTATEGQTQINVGFTVVTKRGNVGGPELAKRFIDAVGGGTERLHGVGEQAIRQRTNAIGAPQIITMRVSNLIVVLSVANLSGGDLPAGAEDGLVKVATTLGTRLAR
ncbi:hypothetical protein KZZ52_05980 [Dactylosporangium sp. AC04546]|uniref:hypothetical protein n=1 Tax=Dactylosporangium sp. AC04546 TaxID=2862460 RepID=UPI001EDD7265|nr:hypothetical protein [Dactylosporangium sp. AC04546]WVK84949.1 hypothetical protein KZZ52_05980 [Dactylosporangium sp. AC04546]